MQAFPSAFAYAGLAYDGVALTPQKPAVRIAAAIALFKIFGIAVGILNQPTVGQNYDNNGNTLYVTNAGSTYTLYYDAENRLNTVYFSGRTIEQYAYDSQNHRLWSWPGTNDTWGNTTNYTVNIYSPSGQKLAGYLLAPGAWTSNQTGQTTPFMQVTAVSGDTYFGSLRLGVMDRLGSAVNAYSPTQTYSPWGETKGTSNPQDTWNFATYWQDSASGLDYANNRYYSNLRSLHDPRPV